MSREASKLIEERKAVEKIIQETREPDIVVGARQLLAEIDAKLQAFNIHPGTAKLQ